jgi:hypothetical protein
VTMKSLSAADFFRNHIVIKRSVRPYSILSLRGDNGIRFFTSTSPRACSTIWNLSDLDKGGSFYASVLVVANPTNLIAHLRVKGGLLNLLV